MSVNGNYRYQMDHPFLKLLNLRDNLLTFKQVAVKLSMRSGLGLRHYYINALLMECPINCYWNASIRVLVPTIEAFNSL